MRSILSEDVRSMLSMTCHPEGNAGESVIEGKRSIIKVATYPDITESYFYCIRNVMLAGSGGW